jgi:hypothetical protein
MYDFRVKNDRRSNLRDPIVGSGKSVSNGQPLQPILENQQAHIAHLKEMRVPQNQNRIDSKRSMGSNWSRTSEVTDDNNILFLDNEKQHFKPANSKTPPPPMWGDVLEEDLWDPKEIFYDEVAAKAEQLRRKLASQKRKHFEGTADGLNRNNPSSKSQNKELKLKKRIVYTYEYGSDDGDSPYVENN